MRLGTKHQNERTITFSDFSGGLNTTTNSNGIAANQLSVAVNVEVDHATGRLRTVAGTIDIINFDGIYAAAYDEINQKILLVKEDRTVYAADLSTRQVGESLGKLNGDLYPISTTWENGILLAAGGKLQYFNGTTLETMDDSPTKINNVYVRAGRVFVTEGNTVRCSGVGDESNWTEDSNDDSSSKFFEVGYKDGGKLVGIVNLLDDVLLIKDNRRLYRLTGDFPNWALSEISRNIETSGRLGICAVADAIFILGFNELQHVQPTNEYGDMKPDNVATFITSEIQNLTANTLLRFVPALNQLWIMNGRNVFMFDLITRSWYKRQFNSEVLDVISIGSEVLVVKPDRVSKLDSTSFSDSDAPLYWKWQGQKLISNNEFLLKRTQVTYSPVTRHVLAGWLQAGGVVVNLATTEDGITRRRRILFSKGVPIYKNVELIYGSPQPIYNRPTVLAESRNVYRHKFIDIVGRGSKSGVVFESVTLTVAEV